MPMKNESHSNKLVLVNSSGQPVTGQESVDDAAYAYGYESVNDDASALPLPPQPRQTLLLFMAVSIACTAAAVATGSYALWLSRHQAAQQALIDVNDLLQTCKTRMEQLEYDVQHLPRRA